MKSTSGKPPGNPKNAPNGTPDNVVAFPGTARAPEPATFRSSQDEHEGLALEVRELREHVKSLTELVAGIVPAIARLQAPSLNPAALPEPTWYPIPETDPSRLLPAPAMPPYTIPPVLPEEILPARRSGGIVFPESRFATVAQEIERERQRREQEALTPKPKVHEPQVLLPNGLPMVPTETREQTRTVIHCADGTELTVADAELYGSHNPYTGLTTRNSTNHRFMGDDGNMLPEDGNNVYACLTCKRMNFARILHCSICQQNLCSDCVNTHTAADDGKTTFYCDHHWREYQRNKNGNRTWFDNLIGDIF